MKSTDIFNEVKDTYVIALNYIEVNLNIQRFPFYKNCISALLFKDFYDIRTRKKLAKRRNNA